VLIDEYNIFPINIKFDLISKYRFGFSVPDAVNGTIIKWIIKNEDSDFFEYILKCSFNYILKDKNVQTEIERELTRHLPSNKNKFLDMINLWLNLGFSLSVVKISELFPLFGGLFSLFSKSYTYINEMQCTNYIELWMNDLLVPLEYIYDSLYKMTFINILKNLQDKYNNSKHATTRWSASNDCEIILRKKIFQHKLLCEKTLEYFYSLGLNNIFSPSNSKLNSESNNNLKFKPGSNIIKNEFDKLDDIIDEKYLKKLNRIFKVQNKNWMKLLNTTIYNLEKILPSDLANICKYYIFSNFQLTGIMPRLIKTF
jgi:hypothetical protein